MTNEYIMFICALYYVYSFCLRYLPESDFDEIHFFGDKAFVGGNDLEIYEHPRTIGHKITEVSHEKYFLEIRCRRC